MAKKKFSKDILKIDPKAEVERICKKMRHLLGRVLKRRGLVVGVSGGKGFGGFGGIWGRATLTGYKYGE